MSEPTVTRQELQRLTGYTAYQVSQLEKSGAIREHGKAKSGKAKSYTEESVLHHIHSELSELKTLRKVADTGEVDDPDRTLKLARANRAIFELLEAANTRIPLDVALNEQAAAMIELRSEVSGLPREIALQYPKGKRREIIGITRKWLAVWLADTADKIKSKLAEASAVRDEHFRILQSIREAKLISQIEQKINAEERAEQE